MTSYIQMQLYTVQIKICKYKSWVASQHIKKTLLAFINVNCQQSQVPTNNKTCINIIIAI